MDTTFLENYGIGIMGVVFGFIYWIIDYFLHKDSNGYKIIKSILAAIIIVGIYVVFTRFLFNGFEKESWEDTKRFIILISLLLAVNEANSGLKNITNSVIKNFICFLKWLAAGFALFISIGMFLNNEQVLKIIEIINDVWGISITLYTAFLVYVIRRNSNDT
ncbi:hypothetical protein EXW28_22310 [Bacillus mycoides]|uniref:hypothetical protein n=1 Tax=Bacillus mycoides TaxID=1405 RepID=UPI001C038DEA|nr:hypothetical protein [Bacillus mycoides]QWG52452.1 hypothetical protein EXW37_22305 [Bacillus mycoides]QWH36255.1 hypothetical protein EXW28_22310 [Bacillus mycoides]